MNEISNDLFLNNSASALQYGLTEGYGPLREKIAARLKNKCNIGREFDDTIVVTGGQQCLDLTCKILCNEHDTVICENPSFIGALNAFRAYNTRLCGIPMEEDGIDVAALEKVLKTEKNVKMIYTIPTFQNPMGVCMSLEKRKAVYALAKKYGVVILEDNPYGELRFKGQDIPTIKSLDTDGIVVYCGSFSKVLSPGIRIGFVCAPKEIISKLVVAKQVTDVHTNILCQRIIDGYLEKFDIDEHIASIRDLYGKKSAAIQEAVKKYLPGTAEVTNPEGGIFLWLDLPGKTDAMEFTRRCMDKKVAVVPGNSFNCDEEEPSSGVRLNYSMPTFEQIDTAMQKIGEVVKSL